MCVVGSLHTMYRLSPHRKVKYCHHNLSKTDNKHYAIHTPRIATDLNCFLM